MPKIIDIIDHRSAYSTQRFIVLDQMPNWVYSRHGQYFIANDDGIYDFLAGGPGKGDAFGGREFDISPEDGTTFHSQGNVWSSGHGGHVDEPTIQAGIGTIERLRECYVFLSASVSVAKIDEWLETNTPSSNYHKYDPRHTIEWLDSIFTKGDRLIGSKRARVLRRRGVRIFCDEDGNLSWSPHYEKRRAALATPSEQQL